MKRMKRIARLHRRLRTVACLGGVIGFAALSAVGVPLQVLLPGEASAGAADDPAVTRTRLVKATEVRRQAVAVAQPQDRIVLPFFPDATYTVGVTRVSAGYGGATIIEGVVEGVADASFLSIAAPDGTRYELRDPERRFLYHILSQPDGTLAVREYDDTKRPPVHDLPSLEPPRRKDSSAERTSVAADEPRSTTSTVIDLMLVLDTKAQTWAAANGGLTTVANAAVSRMNLALANSGVAATFRLVHIWSSGHTYSGCMSTDLQALQCGTGTLSEAPALRNTVGADIVSLLVDTGSSYGSVGLAYTLWSSAGYDEAAFSVCSIRSVNISHTLTHEIGHNLGCGHSKFQAADTGPAPLYTYAAGWYFTGNNSRKYHTVMAYDSDGYGNTYNECAYFSTPLVTYQGVAVGHATDGDNVRTITNVKEAVAAYRTAEAGVAATPQFAPLSGTTFSSSLEVTLACSTLYAAIRYTTDGSEPTESSTLYAAAITLSDTTTVKAKAFASGMDSSAIATATYIKSSALTADAVDNVLLKWTTGGAAKWVAQTVVTADCEDAAASGAMAAGKTSYVQTSATGAGTLRFAWSVSGAGVLRLYDGKAELAVVTNETVWQTRTITLSQSVPHTLKWEFTQGGDPAAHAYLDQVVWLPGGAAGVAVTAAPSDPRGGTASGTGVYYAGAKVPLNAAARPGWLFAGWTPATLFAKPLTAAQTLTLGGSAVAVTAQFVKVPVVTGLPQPPEGGTVTGSGLCPPGKSVTLKAAPAKGWWFMRWSDGAQTAARTVAAAEDVTLHAVFKRIAEIAPPTLSNPGPRQVMVGVAILQALCIDSECLPTVKVTGLPTGLKYDANTVSIVGVPSKVGVFTTTFSASNPGGSAVAVAFPITVAPLSAWAQGGFGGAAGTAAHGGGSASLSVTALGKVSGKLALRGTNVTFSAASYAGRDGDGAFLIAATAKVGKASWPLALRVFTPERADPDGIAPATLSKAEGTLAGGGWLALWRNVWQDPGMAAVLTNGVAGYYTATLPGGAEHGSGYLTMTVDKGGGVKTAGKLADGTAVSLSGPLLLDEAGRLFTVLYTAPKAYAGGGLYGLAEFFRAGGGARTLVRPLDGEPFAWESLSPQATAIYGEGFWRELGVDGGWYDTLGNLYDHYRDRDLSAGTDEGAPAPVLTVGTTRYASVWWRPDGLALSAVTNKSGVMTGLAAPKAGAPVDPEKDGTWDYGATNTVGLTITLTRPTGIFKGSFKAWFDYAATHTSKPLAFEGVLTPERADPDDGIAGRGYFPWPDQAWYDTGKLDRAGAPVLKAYKYNLSYDFLLLAE